MIVLTLSISLKYRTDRSPDAESASRMLIPGAASPSLGASAAAAAAAAAAASVSAAPAPVAAAAAAVLSAKASSLAFFLAAFSAFSAR